MGTSVFKIRDENGQKGGKIITIIVNVQNK